MAAPASQTPKSAGQRILIVDDAADVRELISELLQGWGHHVAEAGDGNEAARQIAASPPDVILLDVSLPGRSGMDILDDIRHSDLDAAVILITGHGSEEVVINALRRGADEYLRKPFGHHELRDVLGRAVQRLQTRRSQAALQRELLERAAKSEADALLDTLTQLPNRRFFDRELALVQQAAERDRTSQLALIAIDLDHFKQVNDTYGHQAGDAALREVSSILAGNVRKTDSVARIGGEEFCVLLPSTDAQGAMKLAQELGRRVAEAGIAVEGATLHVTISAGVAAWQPGVDLVRAADEALYRAKELGRNRVELARQ